MDQNRVYLYLSIIPLVMLAQLFKMADNYRTGYRWFKEFKDSMYFGTYTKNPTRVNVSVYCRETWQILTTFHTDKSFQDLSTEPREWVLSLVSKQADIPRLPKKISIVVH